MREPLHQVISMVIIPPPPTTVALHKKILLFIVVVHVKDEITLKNQCIIRAYIPYIQTHMKLT